MQKTTSGHQAIVHGISQLKKRTEAHKQAGASLFGPVKQNSKKCEKSSKVKPIPNEVFALRYGCRPSQYEASQ
jgi:hypothetical protein